MAVTTPLPKIDSGDTYAITNNTNHTITLTWNSQKIQIAPGSTKFVGFDFVRLYFGDPRSIPGSTKRYHDSRGEGEIPKREEEVRRLSVLYGVYSDGMDKVPEAVPDCSIKTADGREIICPAVDPEGLLLTEAETLDIDNVDNLKALIQRHEQQISELRRQNDYATANGSNDGIDVVVDGSDDEFAGM